MFIRFIPLKNKKVLLTITSNSNTLDTMSTMAGQDQSNLSIILVAFLFISILIYFYIKSMSDQNTTIEKTKEPFLEETKQGGKNNSDLEKEEKLNPTEPIKEKIIEHSKPKQIGYNPINVFEQTEPLSFPYVIMPKVNSVIKFPQKGKSKREGYKEADFKQYLLKYFSNNFQLYNDRFILVRNENKFEPDFTIVDEKDELNLFIDIEIDEPYEGINDVSNRKATHFQYADTNRNNAFKSRGWIVIRFAEIQVHQNPNGCCLFIADVIKSINPNYTIPNSLLGFKKVDSVKQWTKEEAEEMSKEKYREYYLGIEKFGKVQERIETEVLETEEGNKVEALIKDEPVYIPVIATKKQYTSTKYEVFKIVIDKKQFISFDYEGIKTIVKPLRVNQSILSAYCYVKNIEKDFELIKIKSYNIKEKPFTVEATGPSLGIERAKDIVNTAIDYNRFIRMRYTRAAWTEMSIDEKTGEIIMDVIEAEESIRTIGNIRPSVDELNEEHINRYSLNENHITAFCFRKDAKRTFRFDRISELAILNL
jgi:hypothetical protein